MMRWNSVSSTNSASSVKLGVSGEHRHKMNWVSSMIIATEAEKMKQKVDSRDKTIHNIRSFYYGLSISLLCPSVTKLQLTIKAVNAIQCSCRKSPSYRIEIRTKTRIRMYNTQLYSKLH